MKFVDSIEILVRSGAGGAGLVSFKAARNKPKLGADGGDGGFGGNVYFRGRSGLNTLSHLYHKRLYAAEKGVRGGPNGRTGRDGKDVVIDVPLGTVVRDAETTDRVGEIMQDDELFLVAKGGKRGLGNMRYLSPTHQAPQEHTGGGPGIELALSLELKLIADVGLAGFPNAGKSTLLSVISAAKPKIAAYPFTTLVPNLGVVTCGETWEQSFVVADIPGLIAGASEGRGLGHQFLKHVERTKVLAIVLDGSAEEPMQNYTELLRELKQFNIELSSKEKMLVFTKKDLFVENREEELRLEFEALGMPMVFISAVSQIGLSEAKFKLYELVETAKNTVVKEPESEETDNKQEFEWISTAADFQTIETSSPTVDG